MTGLITLVVTVVAGIVIWLVTRTPENYEQLTYRVESPANFVSPDNTVKFTRLIIKNNGKLKSFDVVILARIADGERITGRSLSYRAARIIPLYTSFKPNEAYIKLESMFRGEEISLSLLTSGRQSSDPKLSVYSSQQVATKVDGTDSRRNPETKIIVFIVIVASALSLQLVLIRTLGGTGALNSSLRKFLKIPLRYYPERGNAAFLLLHSLMFEKSRNLLEVL